MATIRFQMQMNSSLGSESFSLVSRTWEGRGAILIQSLHHPSSIPWIFDSLEGNPSAILSADGPRKETTEKQRVTFERCSGICDQDDRMVS